MLRQTPVHQPGLSKERVGKRHRATCPCGRCGGMVIATYADLLSPNQKGEAAIGWRCVNRGDYVDRQVLVNRSARGNMTAHAAPREVQHRSIPQRA